MDIESFLFGLFGGAGIGGLTVHFLKKYIDHYFEAKSSSYAEKRESLKKQSDLLKDFLGEPWSKLIWLSNNLDKSDRTRKQNIAVEINDWLIKHRPYFPGEIQFVFSQIALSACLLANDHPDLVRSNEESPLTGEKGTTKGRWLAKSPDHLQDLAKVESLGLLLGEPESTKIIRQILDEYVKDPDKALAKFRSAHFQ